ncbi:alpha/beta fold hydrolase [Paenibacillus methanolicus]|uniref:Pimeloyl-ACP methyl ester carboxylesterase n=1 Tax=Paenibacillus methanolicus TaxID=582686 RepID=A0A5S5CB73_9BACL|nr:alpha/beta hydrolase [Paenibacillus methanolicus]TYP76604.1 pimeloyl-ACP methyl ester carboxylesterase [Paenibacillus methanolicus]
MMKSNRAAYRSEALEVGRFMTEAGQAAFRSAYDKAMALLPFPVTVQDVDTGFGAVRVYQFGHEANLRKEPLLLLPGRSSSTPMWEPNLQGLMRERPVYALDLLGEAGMSVQTKPIADRRDQARWLDETLSGLKLERVHLLGVSIGGWTAMNIARFYPERVASVSLLDPVFVFAPISLKMAAASIPASVPFVPKCIRQQMLSYISGGAKTDDGEPIAQLIETAMRVFKLKLPTPDRFSAADLQQINIPVLALMAEKSTMHDSAKAVKNGRENVPSIEIINWPNASHAINGEFPNEVNAAITTFVKKHANDSP